MNLLLIFYANFFGLEVVVSEVWCIYVFRKKNIIFDSFKGKFGCKHIEMHFSLVRLVSRSSTFFLID